jgi:hypothetical protein
LLKAKWLKGIDWFHGEGQASWEFAMGTLKQSWLEVKQAIQDKKLSFSVFN